MEKTQGIFDLSRTDWDYRGILFAEMDIDEMEKQMRNISPPIKQEWIAGLMMIIWIDENKEWNMKCRIKFPSGNKQIMHKNYGKDCSETKILQELYHIPLKNKVWTRNEVGTSDGMLDIMKNLDMIESIRVVDEKE